MPLKFDDAHKEILHQTLPAIITFKKTFHRDISAGFLAELLVAAEFGLTLADGPNQQGADAYDDAVRRYQIKFRSPTSIIDLNNFDFDELVLVNLDDNYEPLGIWVLPRQAAQQVFVQRPDFRKYQASQGRIKSIANRIR